MAMDFTTIWKAKALHAYVPPPWNKNIICKKTFGMSYNISKGIARWQHWREIKQRPVFSSHKTRFEMKTGARILEPRLAINIAQ
jgi:hypothetical protein